MSEQKAPEPQHLPAVVAVLDAQAHAGDEQPEHGWELYLNSLGWRVTAATEETYPDAGSAQAGANALLDALVAASHARLRQVQYGAARGYGRDVFRGVVEVTLYA